MLANFFITFRETLEAVLVVGIILAYLSRTGQKRFNVSVWWGVAAGIAGSILAAVLFYLFFGGLSGRTEQIFEGITMLVAAVLLTWMILWMMKQEHVVKEIEEKVSKETVKSHPLGIAILAGVAVFREGVETVIFLSAASFVAGGMSFAGAFLGMLVAILLGYIFFMGIKKIKIKLFFQVTSIVLILFAAGLVAYGIHEFQEASVLPTFIEHVYDINHVIDEKGTVGSLLKALFGYNGNPSLLEIISYLGYLLLCYVLYRNIEKIHKII
jgi:high-affinity iron transporter